MHFALDDLLHLAEVGHFLPGIRIDLLHRRQRRRRVAVWSFFAKNSRANGQGRDREQNGTRHWPTTFQCSEIAKQAHRFG